LDIPDALTSAGAGMRAQADRLDVVAQNLANASTIGYRSQRWIGRGFGDRLQSAVATANVQGTLRRTDVATDMALSGNGFFSVMTPDGTRYTRDGRMSVNADAQVCDARGNLVLGIRGPASYPRGAKVELNGRIVAGGRLVDRLRIVAFDGPFVSDGAYLRPSRDTRIEQSRATLRCGYLEDSGVDPIAEMTALIGAQRAFEANQKALQRADEALQRAVSDVPAVRS